MKSIQIISEDIYGCDFFKEVAHRINREVRVFCNSAQAWSPKRGRIFAASNADLVIVCIDADARDPEEVEREQLKIIKRSARSEQDVEKRLKIVVFSYEAEEWIIASMKLKISGDKPSEVLRGKMGYEKKDLPKYAPHLDFNVLREMSVRSFIEFEKAVKDL
jgi:hypothetical protein